MYDGVPGMVGMDSFRRTCSDILREKIRRGEKMLVLDVREESEFEREHIAGAVNVPLEKIKPEEFLRTHPVRPIFIVCTSGKSSYNCADLFYKAGCQEVYTLAGGLLSWKVFGFPLVGTDH